MPEAAVYEQCDFGFREEKVRRTRQFGDANSPASNPKPRQMGPQCPFCRPIVASLDRSHVSTARRGCAKLHSDRVMLTLIGLE